MYFALAQKIRQKLKSASLFVATGGGGDGGSIGSTRIGMGIFNLLTNLILIYSDDHKNVLLSYVII